MGHSSVVHLAKRCTIRRMGHDLSRLAELGRKRQRLRQQLEDLRPVLEEEIRAAHAAEVEQTVIASTARVTRETVRWVCLDEQQRQEERKKRKRRTTKG